MTEHVAAGPGRAAAVPGGADRLALTAAAPERRWVILTVVGLLGGLLPGFSEWAEAS
ncbi:MAG: hypothetical protein ABIO33_07790 [Leifsonia sp.]